MKEVYPIKDIDVLNALLNYYYVRNERDYVLFNFGIYAPLRISDILRFKVRDVRGKEHFYITEKKTKKPSRFPLNNELKKVLNHYIQDKKDHEYLFASRQKNKNGIHGPISRQTAWRILNSGAKEMGIEKIGCHSLRKTFGYHYYRKTKDIMMLKEIFNHADIAETRHYIGLTETIRYDAIKSFTYD
ncbi:tyrosine-type recombinase/integrase [Vallitaleaceae bacterium 9-2]